ncbi:hypothetical protein C1645_734533 [Glomus cerebriforme]|uniref:Uncharacterized protein n=1 Tax=Glomus cerebriforme TaxID=658196 RepID=A0A397T9D6_9GLOM|nr:hypothetical protein C1645_734533 [Glomus cerebriforme]
MKCLLTFLFFSCKFSELFSPEWKGKQFSELFSPEWEGKRNVSNVSSFFLVLFAFELVHEIGNDQAFFQFRLGNLKHSNQMFLLFLFSSENSESEKKYLALESEMKINVLIEHFFFSFVDLALETETET